MKFRPLVPQPVQSFARPVKPEYVVDSAGCWIWQRAVSGGGYGKVTRRGKSYGAHVMMWERHRGPIPLGLEPDHVVCNVRLCVNPDHMELVTRSVNVKRGWSNGGAERRARERAARSAGQRRRWERAVDQ